MYAKCYVYTGSIYDSSAAPGGIEGYKHYISWIKRELMQVHIYVVYICIRTCMPIVHHNISMLIFGGY